MGVVANTYTMTYAYPHYISDDCKTNTCLGSSGRIGLWIAFGCMFVPMLIFWFKAASKPAGQRKFEYLSMAINGIASLAYLTMATGYGAKIVNGQEFFFARYIDWTLTTPLMLVDLILLAHGAKAKMETILHIVAVDMLMVVGGLIGALQGADESKWVFFAFSMFMFCPIFFYLRVHPGCMAHCHLLVRLPHRVGPARGHQHHLPQRRCHRVPHPRHHLQERVGLPHHHGSRLCRRGPRDYGDQLRDGWRCYQRWLCVNSDYFQCTIDHCTPRDSGLRQNRRFE